MNTWKVRWLPFSAVNNKIYRTLLEIYFEVLVHKTIAFLSFFITQSSWLHSICISLFVLEAYPDPCQTSKMELFTEIVNDFESFTIFAKSSIFDVQICLYVLCLFKVFQKSCKSSEGLYFKSDIWIKLDWNHFQSFDL